MLSGALTGRIRTERRHRYQIKHEKFKLTFLPLPAHPCVAKEIGVMNFSPGVFAVLYTTLLKMHALIGSVFSLQNKLFPLCENACISIKCMAFGAEF